MNRNGNRLFVRIRDINTITFEGYVKALSSINDRGLFDILPYHTNFISIIKEKIIIHKEDGSHQEIPIDAGVLKQLNNTVQVFLGIKALT
jgi:F0F1-type ATP synthase epsilon subunit